MKQYMQIAQVGLSAISPFLPPVGLFSRPLWETHFSPTLLNYPNPTQYQHNNPPKTLTNDMHFKICAD